MRFATARKAATFSVQRLCPVAPAIACADVCHRSIQAIPRRSNSCWMCRAPRCALSPTKHITPRWGIAARSDGSDAAPRSMCAAETLASLEKSSVPTYHRHHVPNCDIGATETRLVELRSEVPGRRVLVIERDDAGRDCGRAG